jgi:hypothetical protein
VPTTAAFLAFVLAVTLLGRLPSRDVLALLADPASIGVLCLVVFSGVLGRLNWLRNLLFNRRSSSPGAIRRRFLAVTGLAQRPGAGAPARAAAFLHGAGRRPAALLGLSPARRRAGLPRGPARSRGAAIAAGEGSGAPRHKGRRRRRVPGQGGFRGS